jgi:hypothetical protein
MTMQRTPTTAPRPGWHTPVVMTAASVFLGVALATGLGLVPALRSGATRTAERAATVAPPATESLPPASQPAAAGATVYLVESESQAQTLRTALAESDAIRAAQGQPMLPHGVLWFDAAEAEVQFWATQQMLGSGAATAVIDLRPSAVAGAIETVYLVSTPEQAEALRARITADADQLGTLRPNARVVVEGSDEAAIALRVITDMVPAGLIHLVDRRAS